MILFLANTPSCFGVKEEAYLGAIAAKKVQVQAMLFNNNFIMAVSEFMDQSGFTMLVSGWQVYHWPDDETEMKDPGGGAMDETMTTTVL
jgi:hypothetical protein